MKRSIRRFTLLLLAALLLMPLVGCGRPAAEATMPRHHDLLSLLPQATVESPNPNYVLGDELVFAAGEGRFSLFEHPDSQVTFPPLPIYQGGRLTFGIALHQDTWTQPGDGVRFVVEGIDESGTVHDLYERRLDPYHRPQDQGWFDESVDLGRFAGRQLQIVLRTEAGASNQNDWAAWSTPWLLSWEEAAATDADASGQPNIVLITLDTLRADHVSAYGYPRRTTPVLDRLAADGVLFERAYSQCEHTNPSHLTMLTARYPRSHGILNNHTPVPFDLLTIPERLQQQGYHTAAVVSAYHLGPVLQMDQGFADFYPCDRERRPGEVTTEIAVEWLQEQGEEPFFLWVHYFDPHAPYQPPYPYEIMYQPPSAPYTLPMSEVRLPDNWPQRYGDWPPPVDDIAAVIAAYDGAVAYTDAQVGRLLAALDQQGLTERTIVIATSDHGEGFGEHGVAFDHFGLHREMVQVPLIIRYPGRLPRGRVVSDIVGHVDLGPTLWELLGMAIPDDMQGISLVAPMEGRRWTGHEGIVSQQHDDMATALRSDDWLLIQQRQDSELWPDHPLQAGSAALFNLEADPEEQENLAPPSDAPARRAQRDLAQRLLDWGQRTPIASWGATTPLDEETEEMLRRLGY